MSEKRQKRLREMLAKGIPDRLRLEKVLLANMKQQWESLRALLDRVNGKWAYEDGVYRFYHQSFKVFFLQTYTQEMVAALQSIAPEGTPFCPEFLEIIEAGTGREFKPEDNEHWVERTAPIVQAFLHARYFLEMAVKYALELQEAPQMLPSGWATLLCLFEIR
jgi:hypothetical protein